MFSRPTTGASAANVVNGTIVSLFFSVACSYYSESLLVDRAAAAAGAAGVAGAPAGSAGRNDGSGGGNLSQGGTLPSTPTSGSGGGDEAGASVGGTPDASGGSPDAPEGGMGGEAPNPDSCPNDPNKLAPGECGCGFPETCTELRAGLAHRYSFEEDGTKALDAVGKADGSIVGATAALGRVSFDGTTTAYVDLPNGTVSSLKNASFEIWLEWSGGGPWQRIFDFGSNDKGEDSQGEGLTYLYLTPSDGSSGNALRAAFSVKGILNETVARAAAPMPAGTLQHVVLVVDDTNDELRLFLNGSVAALTGFGQSLASLNDVNVWIGRSNFRDGPLHATLEEVRIYRAALTQAQVLASYGFGPNPSFL